MWKIIYEYQISYVPSFLLELPKELKQIALNCGKTGAQGRGKWGEETPSLSPTWYHCDGFQGAEDTEGPESRDVPKVHKLSDVAAGQERRGLQELCQARAPLFLSPPPQGTVARPPVLPPSHQTHAMEMTMKSSQFHGSRRNVKLSMQKPLDSILTRDSKVYMPVKVYLKWER